ISRTVPAKTRNKRSVTGTWRFSFENSGLPVSFIPLKEFRNNLFNFTKLEFDRRWNIEKGKNNWAFRTYAGLGIPNRMGHRYNQGADATRNVHLPFFKQFTAGGPNSMRAWGVRNLNSYSTRTNTPEVADYYGDMQAEVNAEFRFLLFRGIFGVPIKSAFFIDAGNIWNMKPYDQSLVPQGMSTIDKIYNDIAVAGGTSIRLDFDYFLIRLDFGLKLKTPMDISGNGGWFYKESLNFKEDGLRTIKMQLGINYPF
ncbi:MAG: BamA/TamA family outer membrane protein, partial [Dinghuibacter sp.]|nr:BamA/TamA family outer membrane protein [Dinghuibacter sp.]